MLHDDEPIKWDCRHFLGHKPCAHNRLCTGCGHYQPYTHRIAVIKVAALGDVIRTLAILPELRRRYPQGQVTWITDPRAAAFLAGHPQIDRTLPLEPLTCSALTHERFDLVISLDKEPAPCGLAMSLTARTRLGIGLSPAGTPVPLNPEAVHYFQLGLSDELKFRRNTKSQPQLLYEALGWAYRGERYELPLNPAAADAVKARLNRRGWSADHPTLAVNVGAGKVFANKMWPPRRVAELLTRFRSTRPDVQVLLLGGRDEQPLVQQLRAALPWTIDAGCDNPPAEFIAAVDLCDVLLSGDTMAMHVALARGRRTVVLFGPTCEQEIDLFGLGEKLVADLPCAPCYKRTCDHQDACIHAVETDTALAALRRVMEQARGVARPRRIPLRQAG